MSKKVLVCGGRDFADWETLNEELVYHAFDADLIIHGAARGADKLADEWAKLSGIKRRPFPADWNKYGKAAGPIRNRQMLEEANPNLVIAFRGGNGTADMVRQAREAGIKVIEVA